MEVLRIKNQKTVMIHLVSLCILCAGLMLCRYALFDIHGMKQLPWQLFVCGVAIIASLSLSKQSGLLFSQLFPISSDFGQACFFSLMVLTPAAEEEMIFGSSGRLYLPAVSHWLPQGS